MIHKNFTFGGNTCYDVETKKGKEIIIFGVNGEGNIFSKSFKIGDDAEYDSYNYSYVGKIKQITDKTVTIVKDYRNGQAETKRLKIKDFAWRNYNFDLERIEKERHDHLHYG